MTTELKVANGRLITRNVKVEPSLSYPDAWYWVVKTDDGEVYAEGEGDQSYDLAVWSAIGSFERMKRDAGC